MMVITVPILFCCRCTLCIIKVGMIKIVKDQVLHFQVHTLLGFFKTGQPDHGRHVVFADRKIIHQGIFPVPGQVFGVSLLHFIDTVILMRSIDKINGCIVLEILDRIFETKVRSQFQSLDDSK